ncbi:sugar transferase [Halobacteriovorax sp. HLS]|uniref:sugar transferase n=1 Tax=Halobacteriovorax sp. HLS TaxID=2234000 RepID=UPI000FD8A2F3
MYPLVKRIFDIFFALFALVVFSFPFLLVCLLVKLTSKGDILYWSDRVGLRNTIFSMPKVRTMKVDTPQVATHLLTDSRSFLTPIGGFLRKSSLDEIPQLWSILIGDLSFVGPRPALYNQYDLIELRTKSGVHEIPPGLTGLAQVSGRDELSIEEKVLFDKEYLDKRSLLFDIYIILKTIRKVLIKEGVSH